uniref:Uncharacterized protein n=1 Tax=Strongyloides venezuelensis TaxID=75913 RepID=A0A0K0G5L9_STRVS
MSSIPPWVVRFSIGLHSGIEELGRLRRTDTSCVDLHKMTLSTMRWVAKHKAHYFVELINSLILGGN